MSIQDTGIEGEKIARIFLKEQGIELQQLDWIGKKDGKYVIFEVKHKELFNPPPFLGTGLDKRQIYLRSNLKKDLGLRTYLIHIDKTTGSIYGQYLDVLEQGKYIDMKNNIRIYPIDNFIKHK